MPVSTFPVGPAGPTVDVLIGVSLARANALRFTGHPEPPPIRLRLLVDTGATTTCVETGLLAPLGLPPRGLVPVHTSTTATGPVMWNQYEVSLTLAHPLMPFTIDTLPVVESAPLAGGIQGLIGRDVLAHCLFVYNGTSGTFTLAY